MSEYMDAACNGAVMKDGAVVNAAAECTRLEAALADAEEKTRRQTRRIYEATGSDASCEPIDEHLSAVMDSYQQDIDALEQKFNDLVRFNSDELKPILERLDTIIAVALAQQEQNDA